MTERLCDRVRALVETRYPNSATEAAKSIGIPQPTLHLVIAGKTENPRAQTLQRIAAHFGTTVDWLLTGAGPLPAMLTSETPLAALPAMLRGYGVAPDAQAIRLASSLASPVRECVSAVFRALSTGQRVGDGVLPARHAPRYYAKAHEAGRLFDEMMAAYIDAFFLQWGEKRAREQLDSANVGRALDLINARLLAPMPPAESREKPGRPPDSHARRGRRRAKG